MCANVTFHSEYSCEFQHKLNVLAAAYYATEKGLIFDPSKNFKNGELSQKNKIK